MEHALGDFRVAAAARNNGPLEPFIFRGMPRGDERHANLCPEMPLTSFPGCALPRSQPIRLRQRQGQRYVQAKSVVFGVPGQTRPAALDGGR